MRQFHLIGTDVRRVRPQSIKIYQLNIREIKDAPYVRTSQVYIPSVPQKSVSSVQSVDKKYWHTEFTEYRTHFVCARFSHAKTQRSAKGRRTVND